MIKHLLIAFVLITGFATAQPTARLAEKIRKKHNIPELGYAVVSSDSVYELKVQGIQKAGTADKAGPNDLFRIGSNTKAITGFIAALLVKEGKIGWQTRFFDLFPEMRAASATAYQDLTLLNLLSMRTRLFAYTYTNEDPRKELFTGEPAEQRYQFAAWFFQRPPQSSSDSIHFSNLGYVAAALMLEKVSGKPFKQLTAELGKKLGIHFEFGQPNMLELHQPWGHDRDLNPEAPSDNYKLEWLQAAGNITMSLPDYAKFIQLQLAGLKGRSDLLSAKEFNFLLYGLGRVSVGWFLSTDDQGQVVAYNIGNPGTFLTRVSIYKNANKAIILFSNVQSDQADAGLTELQNELYRKYVTY